MIEIDGSLGEGGGQILRTSLALSLLTQQPFRLFNIRAGRSKPGLQAQHLMSVQAAAKVGNAKTTGASLGSSSLDFEPGEVTAGNHRFEIGTAGATALVLHTIYLPLALRGEVPSEITLVGGTHVSHAPPYHFLQNTWAPHLRRMGLQINLRLEVPGFYPRGGGEIRAVIAPCAQLNGVTLDRRDAVKITGISAVANLDRGIAKRQARQATKRLADERLHANITEQSWDNGPASVLILCAESAQGTATFIGLGARGKPAEAVADEAVEQLLKYLSSSAAVDLHSADQLLFPLALAKGASEFEVGEITEHLLTNAQIISRFMSRKITIEGEIGAAGKVTIAE